MIRTWQYAFALSGPLFLFSTFSPTAFASSIQGDIYNTSHHAVAGVALQLYIDNGDGAFTDADVFTGISSKSDPSGRFSFTDLDPALSYFVMQPAQSMGNLSLPAQVSALERPGDLTYMIDRFEITQFVKSDPVSMFRTGAVGGPQNSIMGEQRDVYVQLMGGASTTKLGVNRYSDGSGLQFDNAAGVTAMAAITWDGMDNVFGMTPGSGLGGMDLTDGGLNDAFAIRMAVDRAGAGQTARLAIFSDGATQVSTVDLPIPVTSLDAPHNYVYAPFADFVGDANPTDVDAIQLVIEAQMPSIDVFVSELGVSGPSQVSFTVPEPAFGAVWSLLTFWAAACGRRRKRRCIPGTVRL